MFLPSLEDALDIVAANSSFTHNKFVIPGNPTVHVFNYEQTASYTDFEQPIKDRPGIKAHELRGLTFVEDPKGDGKSDPERFLALRKFYSYNSTVGYMDKDLANKRMISCGTKLDGSLIQFIKIYGVWYARSMKSFNGPHCDLVNEIVMKHTEFEDYIELMYEHNHFPIFELTDPKLKIVIDYEKPQLRLIQLRSADGSYKDIYEPDCMALASQYGARIKPAVVLAAVKEAKEYFL